MRKGNHQGPTADCIHCLTNPNPNPNCVHYEELFDPPAVAAQTATIVHACCRCCCAGQHLVRKPAMVAFCANNSIAAAGFKTIACARWHNTLHGQHMHACEE